MDQLQLGAAVATVGMLLVCLYEEVRDRRRARKRGRIFAAAQLRIVADQYAARANITRNAPAARIKRSALNTLATDLQTRARRLEDGAR